MDFEVEDSLAESLFGAFSVLVSVFIELLFVESASLFFSLALVLEDLVVLSMAGLFAAESIAGLLAVVDDFIEGDAVVAGTGVGDGFVLTLALAEGVIVAATDAVAAGVMVAPTLAVAAGVALAFVEALVLLVVVAPVVVVPLVEVTPTVKLGVTP